MLRSIYLTLGLLSVTSLISACKSTNSNTVNLFEENPRFSRKDETFNTTMNFGWEQDTNRTEVRIFYTFVPVKDLSAFVSQKMLDPEREYTREEIFPYFYTTEEDNHGTYLAVSPLDSEPAYISIYDKNKFPLQFEWNVKDQLDPIFAGRQLFRNKEFDTSPAPDFLVRGFLSRTKAPGSNDKSLAEPPASSPFQKLGFTHDDAIQTIMIIIYNDADDPHFVRIHYIV